MFRYQLLLVVVFLGLMPGWSAAQETSSGRLSEKALAELHEVEDTILTLAYAIIHDSLPEHRFGACRALIPALVRALKQPNSFDYPFKRVQSISIQYPADSSFRVFTWQLYVDKDDYRYYGAIQLNTPDLQLFPLVDRSFQAEGDLEQQQFQPEAWYGSLYYNIQQTEGPQGKYYLLFGFDGNQFFHRRKLIDVLTFQNGKPVFGAPVFVHSPEKGEPFTKNRVVLEYSASASVHCNYDPALGMIVFDHLEEMGGQYGEGLVHIPDGTYQAYQLKDGLWHHIDKLPTQILDEVPRPEPILDNRTRDILGKQDQN